MKTNELEVQNCYNFLPKYIIRHISTSTPNSYHLFSTAADLPNLIQLTPNNFVTSKTVTFILISYIITLSALTLN